MKLTELLYPYDEVIMSLIQCILKKNFEESLYWAWELLYSGEDIISILNNIFLDFYAVYNPHLERLINILNKYYKLYNNNNCIATIIYNFINSKACVDVFKYRNNTDYIPKYIYKKKEWIKKFPSIYHPLIQSIKMKNYNNISFYLRKCCENYDSDLTHLNIIRYFEYLYHDCEFDRIIKHWKNRYSNNDYHTLLAMIISFINIDNINDNDSDSDISNISNTLSKILLDDNDTLSDSYDKNNYVYKKTNILYKYDNECKCNHFENDDVCICDFNNGLFKFIETPLVEKLSLHYLSIQNDKNYLKLQYRLYPTHKILGPNPNININCNNKNNYKYDRNNYDNIDKIYNNWLYYTKNTPSWKNRLNKYNIKFDDNKNIICHDDLLDKFNEIYDYEYDEQPLHIKNMSDHYIHIYNNYDKWFDSTYNSLNIILNIYEL